MKQKMLRAIGCPDFCYPVSIALFYCVFAFVWIFTTDSLLYKIVGDYHEYRYYETVKSLFFVSLSSIIIFVLVFLNNKKLRRSAQKTSEFRQDIVNFFDATLDKVAIISKDGKIIGHNEAFAHTWPLNLLDSTLFVDGIFQDDKDAMEAEIKKVFKVGKSIDFENRFFDNDGKYAWHSWRMVRSGDGSKVYLVGRNISRQKAYENGLKGAKEECLWLLDNMPLPMYKTDFDGNVVYLNRAWQEFTTEELKTQLADGWTSSLHEDDREAVFKSFIDAVNNRDSWMYEYRLKCFDGQFHWVCDNAKPLYSKEGEYVGYVGALYDIQNRKNAEDELKKKEELLIVQSRFAAMGEMISMIAHQWRQPITVIGMSANNMILDIELESVDNKKFISHLKGIGEQVQYLSKTIDDFRNFFKPNIQKEKTTLSELVHKSIKMISKSYDNNDIKLVFDDGVDSAMVEIHFGEMLQAMLSILNNAKDVLVERKIQNPTVVIRTGMGEGGLARIEIEDNGGGISPSIMDRIFEPYFTTKNEKSGTGLGLYMSKIIVEKHHGGVIGVKNSTDGALFFIDIPLSKAE